MQIHIYMRSFSVRNFYTNYEIETDIVPFNVSDISHINLEISPHQTSLRPSDAYIRQ